MDLSRVRDRLADLAFKGCCVCVNDGNWYPVCVAWLDGWRLCWVNHTPADQSACHQGVVVKAQVVHSRDVDITTEDGTRLYFAPSFECPVDYITLRAETAQWWHGLDKPSNKAAFCNFLEDYLGNVPVDLLDR